MRGAGVRLRARAAGAAGAAAAAAGRRPAAETRGGEGGAGGGMEGTPGCARVPVALTPEGVASNFCLLRQQGTVVSGDLTLARLSVPGLVTSTPAPHPPHPLPCRVSA